MSYVKAAKELPLLSHEEVEREALRLGLVDSASRGAVGEKEGGEVWVRVELKNCEADTYRTD